ncbi:hypothetical protein AAIB41_13940 [Brucella sp. BE17]|uniref:hypothetical protein n=1 Tax=Brucella sp. BE17 TaxID=3142977 RepID=UPI0031B9F2A8
MAVLPDYVSGTITLANGSATVTGTGTLFQAAAFRAGDTLQIQNLTAVIASVDSNTQLTLTESWTGTSLTNAPYRAQYLPDGARVTARTTMLIELLGNGVLSNIADIPVKKGTVLVGNEAGLYEANETLGPFAALDLVANKWLATDASAKPVLINPLDGDSIAKMSLSTYGTYYPGSTGVDLNSAVVGDRGLYATTLPNTPASAGVSNWWIETQRTYTGQSKRQVATSYQASASANPVMAVRVSANDGTWGAWGYISGEYGSNSNGTYVRYPNGLTWCFRTVTPDFNSSSYQSWILPASFTSILGQFSSLNAPNNNDALNVVSGMINRPTPSTFTMAFRGSISSSATGTILLTAVGLS